MPCAHENVTRGFLISNGGNTVRRCHCESCGESMTRPYSRPVTQRAPGLTYYSDKPALCAVLDETRRMV